RRGQARGPAPTAGRPIAWRQGRSPGGARQSLAWPAAPERSANRGGDDDRHPDCQRAEEHAGGDVALLDQAADVERVELVEEERGDEEEDNADPRPRHRES